ncbi:MAG TPA: hypothetical protein VHB77_11705 [Planctomycetaceae bacterium]|nr:hypothetical protein [Planctomycetaceae bacterium]
MGFFDWLTPKRRIELLEDRVWYDSHAKWVGIAREIENRRAYDRRIVILAHFADTLASLCDVLDVSGVEFHREERALRADELAGESSDLPQTVALLAEQLVDDAGRPVEDPSRESVTILAIERHPLPEPDERIVEFARQILAQPRVRFHTALDEPLMLRLGGSWLPAMLKHLGMERTEPIQSAMVSRALRKAQTQLRRETSLDERAKSAEDWFRINCPGPSPR